MSEFPKPMTISEGCTSPTELGFAPCLDDMRTTRCDDCPLEILDVSDQEALRDMFDRDIKF